MLALGDRLMVSERLSTGLPLPWLLAGTVGGPLAAMVATWRFLSGAAFVLACGLGGMVKRPWVAAVLGCVIVAETMLVAPGGWPLQARAPRTSEVVDALPPGPVAVWPGLPVVSGLRHELLYLALERPVATFSGPPETTAVVAGYRPTVPERDISDRTVSAWLSDVQAQGVQAVVEIVDVPAGLRFPERRPLLVETEGFRVYAMTTATEATGDEATDR